MKRCAVAGFLVGAGLTLWLCLLAAVTGCPLFGGRGLAVATTCRCCGKDCDCCKSCRKGGFRECNCKHCDCCKCCPGRKQAPDCPGGRCPKKPGTGAMP